MAERRVTFLIGANIRNFQKNLKTASARLDRFGQRAERLGSGMQTYLTLPILAAGAAAFKMAGDFETSFTRIETLVGISRSEVDKMRASVLALSSETGKSADELSAALFTITSAGLRGAEAMEVLERAAKASAIGLGETNEIARATTAVVQAYGKENINAAEATDILTAIVREGNLEAESLAPTLGRVIGLASQLGISFSEVGASIATYTRLGVSAEEATTGLRGIMSTLIKPTTQTKDALQGIGTTAEELRRKIQDEGLAVTMNNLLKEFEGNDEALGELIPNVRALSAVLGTAGAQGEAYEQVQKNIAQSTGIVNDGFERTSEDAMFKFNQRIQELRNEFLKTGNVLLPVATKILGKVGELTEKFNQMDDQARRNALTIFTLAAAIGPTIIVIGKLAKVLALAATPIFLKIAALGALVTALEYVRRNSEAFRMFFSDLWSELKNYVLDSVHGMLGALETLMSVLPQGDIAFGSLRAGLIGLKDEVPDREDGYGFQGFTEFIGDLSSDAQKQLEKLANLFFQVKDGASSAMQQVAGISVSGSNRSIGANDFTDNTGVRDPQTAQPMAVNSNVRSIIPGLSRTPEEIQAAIDRMNRLNQTTNFMKTIADEFTNSFGAGMANIVVQGGKLIDVLNNMKKLLLSSAIQTFIGALLTGGLGGSGFFGDGGGLFGKIFGVDDALITSSGDVVKFHPDDNLLAMKDFSNLAPAMSSGGGGITAGQLVSALSQVRWKMDVDKGQIYAAGVQGGARINR